MVLNQEKWVREIQKYDAHLLVSAQQGEEKIPFAVNIAQTLGISITAISVRKPTLEDVFLHYTGKTIRDEDVSVTDQMRSQIRSHRRSHR
jgi:ABC-2 type transport system ATP-binding protein